MTTEKKAMHSIRLEARNSKYTKVVEFPIDEATEKWIMDLQRTNDENSDFVVIGNGAIKMTLSVVHKGFEF